MRILLLDPFHGASGDMIIGSLCACGADRTLVAQAMRSVVADPAFEVVDRAGIRALRVKTHAPQTCRTLKEVMDRLEDADAPEKVLEMAKKVFHRLHMAEESVHGEAVHFHEVGADDAIADVVGACTALESLAVEGVGIFPVAIGRGTIRGAHGTYPLPSPATAAILSESGLRTVPVDEEGELCTPTGAALLAEFATIDPYTLGSMAISATGYGAGSRNPPGVPNVLRALLVEAEGPVARDRVDILETNVDDVSGEIIAYALSRLIEEGARDASAMPAVMKKGRAGHLIRIICRPDDTLRLASVCAAELGTLGIRCIPSVHRIVADRSTVEVEIEIDGSCHTLEVKRGVLGGRTISVKAEYEQARAIAEKLGIPLQEVARLAEEAARRLPE